MPAKSKKQFRFMQAAAHNPAFAEKVGIKPKVAEEYTKENIGKKRYSKLRERIGKNNG
jgi:hypothetical protein